MSGAEFLARYSETETALAIYFTRRRRRPLGDHGAEQVFRVWLDAAAITLWISVGFDVYNVLHALIRGVA